MSPKLSRRSAELSYEPENGPEEWIPKPKHLEAVRLLVKNRQFGLFMDPGVGKTAVTLTGLKAQKDAGMRVKALVLANKKICELVWPYELRKWNHLRSLSGTVLRGPRRDERLAEDHDVYIANFESLGWLLGIESTHKEGSSRTHVVVDEKRLFALGFTHLIVDELTKVKNYSSIRFKALKRIIGSFNHRWGLTGSPASNGLLPLFGQIYILDEGRTLGKFITHYRTKYFHLNGYSLYDWQLNEGGDEKIYKAIAPIVLRTSAKEAGVKMPEMVEVDVPVMLPPEARRVYDDLEKRFLAEFGEKGMIVVDNKAMMYNKCRQAANGGIYADKDMLTLVKKKLKDREIIELHEEKVDAVIELLEELQGSPLLLAYEYGMDLSRLRRGLKKAFGKDFDFPVLDQHLQGKKLQQFQSDWNKGFYPLAAGHPLSMGYGLNFQKACNHVGWYTPTWDFEVYDQLNRRVWRQGNPFDTVYVHRFVGMNTIEDRVVLKALRDKETGQNGMFRYFETLQKVRRK